MIVLIDTHLPDESVAQIGKLSPRIQLVRVPTPGMPLPKDALKDAEVIYTGSADFDPADAPRLRWVQTNTAATNPQAGRPMWRSNIPVANVSGAYSAAVAECAMGMLLALTRRITLGCRFQAERKWPENTGDWCGEDLYGTTMGIVGYGSIGRHIAKIADSMGMGVLACKRNPDQRGDDAYLLPGTGDPEGKIPKAWFGADQVADMFRRSDVAMITLPHVPTTDRMIGKKELAALPRHAYVANVGRGAVIDEPELVSALKSGAIAGAALDVFTEEPLPSASPLWDMPSVLVMPHIASWTKTQGLRAAGVLIENLKRDLAGQPLVNVIDRKWMY